jgi:hypothetical protein
LTTEQAEEIIRKHDEVVEQAIAISLEQAARAEWAKEEAEKKLAAVEKPTEKPAEAPAE